MIDLAISMHHLVFFIGKKRKTKKKVELGGLKASLHKPVTNSYDEKTTPLIQWILSMLTACGTVRLANIETVDI